MSGLTFTVGPVDEARAERARRAVSTFRRMLPQFTGFARAITGRDDVRVAITPMGPHTDGTTIYLRPAIALGDDLQHDLRLCAAGRTDTGPVCPACLLREEVVMGLYHEIAHIAFESFAPVSERDRTAAITAAIREREAEGDDKRAALIRERIEKAPWGLADSYKGLASLVSPHLPNIVNAVEDYRVNRELTNARPGTREAFFARYRRVFGDGIEQEDGSRQMWSEAPGNAQAIVALIADLMDLPYRGRGWFTSEVEEMLDHPDVRAALDLAREVETAGDVYGVAFPILEALRGRGFCKVEDDPEPEPEPEPTPEPGTGDTAEPDPGADGTAEPTPSPEPDTDGTAEPTPDTDTGDDSDGSGAEDGDTDEPADEDADGDSDGDASDDDEGEGSGAGDSADADADDADADEGEQGDNAGITGTGDIEGDPSGGKSDRDPDTGADSGEHPGDDDEPGDMGEWDDADTGSDKPLEDSDGEGDWDDEDSDEPSDKPGSDKPEAGSDPGESRLEEEHVGTDGVEDTPEPEPYTADGDPEDAERALQQFLGHDDHDAPTPEEVADAQEVDRAIAGEAFDSGSATVFGIRHHHFDRPYIGSDGINYSTGHYGAVWSSRRGAAVDVDSLRTPETILGPALLRTRALFADNAKWKREGGLRAGKVNSRTLGRRVTVGDDRLFHKRNRPGKKDYHVVIGLDMSGSTRHGAEDVIRAAAFAQAELLRRAGISFEMYAHTGSYHESVPMLAVDIFHIKDANEPWDRKTQERLAAIHGAQANLDGHTLEFYRKQLDKSTASDRVIMYYTDGAMPAENYTEERAILEREIGVCKRKGYTLMAVGVGNDDPVQYGLDTCRIDRVEDVPIVVRHLEKRLRQ